MNDKNNIFGSSIAHIITHIIPSITVSLLSAQGPSLVPSASGRAECQEMPCDGCDVLRSNFTTSIPPLISDVGTCFMRK